MALAYSFVVLAFERILATLRYKAYETGRSFAFMTFAAATPVSYVSLVYAHTVALGLSGCSL